MQYVSTRGSAPTLDFAGVTLAGLANDAGLYVPAEWPRFSPEEIASMRGQTVESIMSYIRAENAEGMLAERILEEKTLNWIFEQAALVAPVPVEEAPEAVEEASEAAEEISEAAEEVEQPDSDEAAEE